MSNTNLHRPASVREPALLARLVDEQRDEDLDEEEARLLAEGYEPALPSGETVDHAEARADGVWGTLPADEERELRSQIATRLAGSILTARRLPGGRDALRVHGGAREPGRPSRARAAARSVDPSGGGAVASGDDPPSSDDPPESGVERADRVTPTARADGYTRGPDGGTIAGSPALSAPECDRRATLSGTSRSIPPGGPLLPSDPAFQYLERRRREKEEQFWSQLTTDTLAAQVARAGMPSGNPEALSFGGVGGQSPPVGREAPASVHTKKNRDRPANAPNSRKPRKQYDTSGYLYPAVRLGMIAWKREVAAQLRLHAETLPHGKTKKAILRKATASELCGSLVKVRSCTKCERPRTGSGVLTQPKRSYPCQCRCCPICMRRKAQVMRHQLSHALDAIAIIDGYSWKHITIQTIYNPRVEDDVSIDALRSRLEGLWKAIRIVWKKGLRQPGAAMSAHIEISGAGFVHAHILYYGPFIAKDWFEKTAKAAYDQVGRAWIERVVKPEDPDGKKIILEVAKYPLKGPSPLSEAWVEGRSRDVTNPVIAARWEIATHGKPVHGSFGALRDLEPEEVAVREAEEDETRSAEDDGDVVCEHCAAKGKWEWIYVETERWARHCHGVGSPALHGSRWSPPRAGP